MWDAFIFSLIVFLLVFLLIVAFVFIFIRWVFRIDKIVAELMRIRRHLDRMNPDADLLAEEPTCAICGFRPYSSELEQIESGQLVCKQCRAKMKKEG